MAEVAETLQTITENKAEESASVEDMELVSTDTEKPSKKEENGGEEVIDASTLSAKRSREEGDEAKEEENGVLKKPRTEKSFEENRVEEMEKSEEKGVEEEGEKGKEEEEEVKEGDGEDKETGPVTIGPKDFCSSLEMFDYFYKFLHFWPTNVDVNKYEYLALLDLIKKGHPEPAKKIGEGIQTFQVRYHPMWKSRCYFLIREDGFVDDFSFRKCIDNILPLPENMKSHAKWDGDKKSGGGGGRGGGRGRGRGHGRGRGRGGFRK